MTAECGGDGCNGCEGCTRGLPIISGKHVDAYADKAFPCTAPKEEAVSDQKPTPMTDACLTAINERNKYVNEEAKKPGGVMLPLPNEPLPLSDFCRQLERELAERTAELKVESELSYARLQSWEKAMAKVQELRRQLEDRDAEIAAAAKELREYLKSPIAIDDGLVNAIRNLAQLTLTTQGNFEQAQEALRKVINFGKECAVSISGDPDDAQEVSEFENAFQVIKGTVALGKERNNEANILREALRRHKYGCCCVITEDGEVD